MPLKGKSEPELRGSQKSVQVTFAEDAAAGAARQACRIGSSQTALVPTPDTHAGEHRPWHSGPEGQGHPGHLLLTPRGRDKACSRRPLLPLPFELLGLSVKALFSRNLSKKFRIRETRQLPLKQVLTVVSWVTRRDVIWCEGHLAAVVSSPQTHNPGVTTRKMADKPERETFSGPRGRQSSRP